MPTNHIKEEEFRAIEERIQSTVSLLNPGVKKTKHSDAQIGAWGGWQSPVVEHSKHEG